MNAKTSHGLPRILLCAAWTLAAPRSASCGHRAGCRRSRLGVVYARAGREWATDLGAFQFVFGAISAVFRGCSQVRGEPGWGVRFAKITFCDFDMYRFGLFSFWLALVRCMKLSRCVSSLCLAHMYKAIWRAFITGESANWAERLTAEGLLPASFKTRVRCRAPSARLCFAGPPQPVGLG